MLSMLRFSLDEWRESGDRRRLEQMNAKLLVRDKERDAVLTDMRKELMRYKEQARRADLRGVAPTVADNRRVSPVADSIQTAEGSCLGVGGLPLKRRGLAAKAALRVCARASMMAGVRP